MATPSRPGPSATTARRSHPERLAEYDTVPELFDVIQDAIDRDAAEIRVTYAASGYPDEVWLDYDEQIADEELGFFIHALTPA